MWHDSWAGLVLAGARVGHPRFVPRASGSGYPAVPGPGLATLVCLSLASLVAPGVHTPFPLSLARPAASRRGGEAAAIETEGRGSVGSRPAWRHQVAEMEGRGDGQRGKRKKGAPLRDLEPGSGARQDREESRGGADRKRPSWTDSCLVEQLEWRDAGWQAGARDIVGYWTRRTNARALHLPLSLSSFGRPHIAGWDPGPLIPRTASPVGKGPSCLSGREGRRFASTVPSICTSVARAGHNPIGTYR